MQNTDLQRKLCVSKVMIFYISINNLHYFFNPAPQNGQRDGVKEDYYVQKIDVSGFFCLGSEHSG